MTVHQERASGWMSGDAKVLQSVAVAINESEDAMNARRLKNLAWARGRTWSMRANQVRKFLQTIKK